MFIYLTKNLFDYIKSCIYDSCTQHMYLWNDSAHMLSCSSLMCWAWHVYAPPTPAPEQSLVRDTMKTLINATLQDKVIRDAHAGLVEMRGAPRGLDGCMNGGTHLMITAQAQSAWPWYSSVRMCQQYRGGWIRIKAVSRVNNETDQSSDGSNDCDQLYTLGL